MAETVPRVTRVALAVSPRLLADSLGTLLAGEAAVVAVDDEHVDVLLATAPAPDAGADVVVELGNGPHGTAIGTVRGPAGGPVVRLEGLAAVLDFIRRWPVDLLDPGGQG